MPTVKGTDIEGCGRDSARIVRPAPGGRRAPTTLPFARRLPRPAACLAFAPLRVFLTPCLIVPLRVFLAGGPVRLLPELVPLRLLVVGVRCRTRATLMPPGLPVTGACSPPGRSMSRVGRLLARVIRV